jgi:hypothetical protein
LSSQESDAHRASDFRLKLRGNSPYFTVSLPAGQIGLFDPVSLRDSVSETCRGMFRLPRPSGSLLKGRPLSRPAPRSNKKNITDIHGADANRGPGPSSELLGTRPRHRCPDVEGSSADPSGHITHSRLRGRHFHHAAPTQAVYARVTTRWEPAGRLPPRQVPHRPADASRRVAARSGLG